MISNVSSYGSVYENLYASKQTKTNETDEVSETETKTQVAKKST